MKFSVIFPHLISLTKFTTPLGEMIAAATDDGLCLLEFSDRRALPTELKALEKRLKLPVAEQSHSIIETAINQLTEYFGGKRKAFDIPLLIPGSPFQQKVWQGLLSVPYGETRSYKAQSVYLGDVKAIRAVAGANGQNRIAIIIPCHRVIGEDGSMTGYGGGVWRKRKLLELEHANSSAPPVLFY